MKKYLLPLILILLLTFALIANSADLFSTYDQRIKLTVDHYKIAGAITTKEQIGTTSYDGFGLLIKTGADTIIYFFREGTDHSWNGKIVKQVYTISTDSWGARSDVFDDANDLRNASGGIIGTNIYLFFQKRDNSTAEQIDAGYIKSTDLTGDEWGDWVSIWGVADGYGTYGALIPTASATTFLQPIRLAADSSKLLKTIDSGDNWTLGATIDDSESYGETSVAYIGDGEMIALLRNDDEGYVGQSVSDDNGATWSAVSNTNLGNSTGLKVSWIYYDSDDDTVIAIYHDRCSPYETKISKTDAATVYASATSWNPSSVIDSGFELNGYPSMVNTDTDEFFFVYSKEISLTDADIWGGTYILSSPGALTNFPVTAFFTAAQGEEIFTEFDADEDFDRGQFALGDDTLLKAEKELFDDSESLGIYHFKVPSVSDSANTDIYFYYDNDAGHNTDYIGVINTATGAEVWDNKAVHHLVDATISTVVDSTSNDIDGAKHDDNEPIEATAKVGKGQTFDGTDDEIDCGNVDVGLDGDFTWEVIYNGNMAVAAKAFMAKRDVGAPNVGVQLLIDMDTEKIIKGYVDLGATLINIGMDNNSIVNGVPCYVVFRRDGTEISLWLNGGLRSLDDTAGNDADVNTADDFTIGMRWASFAKCTLDEVRIADSARADHWIATSYNSLWDTLLTYGDEETPTGGIVWNGITITKWNGITITKINGK